MDPQLTPTKTKKKAQASARDRISLEEATASRIDGLLLQAQTKIPGIRLTRSDLVNLLLDLHSETLSPSELKALEGRYFDEIRFAQWALKELKEAHERGDKLRLSDILTRTRTSEKTTTPRPKNSTKKVPPVAQSVDADREQKPQETLEL